MPLEPKSADLPRIRGALRLYQVSSVITGLLLLALCAEMIMKYAFGLELELGGSQGFLAFVPGDTITAVNLSTGILIVHGWFYVVYLFSDFRLWSLMRWPFGRFILIALGGIIPFLSFILEVRVAREVRAYLAQRASTSSATGASSEAGESSLAEPVEASPSTSSGTASNVEAQQ
jgi:integral membrane protein